MILLDIARHRAESSKVVLFADGLLRERLEQAGIAVEVLPAPRTVGKVTRGANLVRDLRAVPGVLELAWNVSRLARDYDVIYANSQKTLIVGALAGKISRKPVIWHQHDVLNAEHFSPLHRWLVVTWANHMVERVIACSKAAAGAFVEGGGRTDKVRAIYNGIDPGPFASVAPAEVDRLRQSLGLDRALVVGVFGYLAPGKGQHVLLEALTRLPEVHALIVGEPAFGDYAYARALHVKAEALEVTDRVHFLGFRTDIPQLMHLCDVVTLTSIAPESFGRVTLEGMLSHRPVVATRVGGVGEVVEDHVNGLLVPPGDVEALARALDDLLTDHSQAIALAEAGYATASERFSLWAMLEGVTQQIQEVASMQRLQRFTDRFFARWGLRRRC